MLDTAGATTARVALLTSSGRKASSHEAKHNKESHKATKSEICIRTLFTDMLKFVGGAVQTKGCSEGEDAKATECTG